MKVEQLKGVSTKMCEHRIVVVRNADRTLPRAFISPYVGLETSNHHDGQDPFSEPAAPFGMGLGTRSRDVLLGSRCLPFPVLLRWPWVTRGEEGMPLVTTMVGTPLSF